MLLSIILYRCCVCIQWVNKKAHLFTLLSLLYVQGYEDWLRHKADNAVNQCPVNVVQQGKIIRKQSRKLQVCNISGKVICFVCLFVGILMSCFTRWLHLWQETVTQRLTRWIITNNSVLLSLVHNYLSKAYLKRFTEYSPCKWDRTNSVLITSPVLYSLGWRICKGFESLTLADAISILGLILISIRTILVHNLKKSQ